MHSSVSHLRARTRTSDADCDSGAWIRLQSLGWGVRPKRAGSELCQRQPDHIPERRLLPSFSDDHNEGGGVGSEFIVFQGTVPLALTLPTIGDDVTWRTVTMSGLTARNFVSKTGANPDFSSTGGGAHVRIRAPNDVSNGHIERLPTLETQDRQLGGTINP